jgi:hypothetical protein
VRQVTSSLQRTRELPPPSYLLPSSNLNLDLTFSTQPQPQPII